MDYIYVYLLRIETYHLFLPHRLLIGRKLLVETVRNWDSSLASSKHKDINFMMRIIMIHSSTISFYKFIFKGPQNVFQQNGCYKVSQ